MQSVRSAIDAEGRATLAAHLRRVQKTEAIPVLYVTHSTEEAMRLAERVFLLDHGQIVAQGTIGLPFNGSTAEESEP